MSRHPVHWAWVLVWLAAPALAAEDIPLFTFEPTDTGASVVQYALTGADAALEARFTVYWSGGEHPRAGLDEKQQCLYAIESVDCSPYHRATLRRLGCATPNYCRLRLTGFDRGISVCETKQGWVSGTVINDRLSLLERVVVHPEEKLFDIFGSDPETGVSRSESFRSKTSTRMSGWFCDKF